MSHVYCEQQDQCSNERTSVSDDVEAPTVPCGIPARQLYIKFMRLVQQRSLHAGHTYHSFYGSESLFSQAGSILKVFEEGLVHPAAASVKTCLGAAVSRQLVELQKD